VRAEKQPKAWATRQSLNRYSYVEDDPVNYADPTGMFLTALTLFLDRAGFPNYGQGWNEFTLLQGDVFFENGDLVRIGGGYLLEPDGYSPEAPTTPASARNRSFAPCDKVTPADLDYQSDGGQKHIEDRHMQTLDTGVVPLNGPSQYVFDQSPDPSTGKAPTHADNFSLIADINAYTFENGTVSQNRRNFNYVFVATLPPEFPSIRPQAGPSPVRPFIGLDYPGKWVPGTPRYFPTNVNTLVVGPDCKTVQTSHPGKPRGQ